MHLPVPRDGYGSLYIELKTEVGDLSPDQKKQMKILSALGNKVVLCRNVADAIFEIKRYLGI
ncbi:VRR-NUC domain-containing protein [Acinetobacter soli]|uniref:VRR-NUC domain-containing protein n=1 Tax=Acinetobacter soli TaxID=487316 RepID=UPI001D19715D|nr:VRR-NUC domain-containing protein [Acinetobacter soli]